MIQELKDAFTVTLAKRLSSPFLSSFFLAWCFWNYDVVLTVFSSDDWNLKLTIIKGSFIGLEYLTRFVAPVGLAVFFVFLWPIFDMRLYKITKDRSIKFKELQIHLEGETPITREEKQELEDKYNKSANIFRGEISQLENKVSELEARNKDLLTRSNELSKQSYNMDSLNEKIETLEKEQQVANSKTAELSQYVEGPEIVHQVKMPVLQAEQKVEAGTPKQPTGVVQAEQVTEGGVIPASKMAEFINGEFSKKPVENTDNKAKKYHYSFAINEKIRRMESKKGIYLDKVMTASFDKEDLLDEVWDELHEKYYKEEINDIPLSHKLFIPKFENNKELNQEWVLSRNPKELSYADIMICWYKDFLEQTKQVVYKKTGFKRVDNADIIDSPI